MFNYFKRSTIASSAEIHSDNNKDNKGYWLNEMEADVCVSRSQGSPPIRAAATGAPLHDTTRTCGVTLMSIIRRLKNAAHELHPFRICQERDLAGCMSGYNAKPDRILSRNSCQR